MIEFDVIKPAEIDNVDAMLGQYYYFERKADEYRATEKEAWNMLVSHVVSELNRLGLAYDYITLCTDKAAIVDGINRLKDEYDKEEEEKEEQRKREEVIEKAEFYNAVR